MSAALEHSNGDDSLRAEVVRPAEMPTKLLTPDELVALTVGEQRLPLKATLALRGAQVDREAVLAAIEADVASFAEPSEADLAADELRRRNAERFVHGMRDILPRVLGDANDSDNLPTLHAPA